MGYMVETPVLEGVEKPYFFVGCLVWINGNEYFLLTLVDRCLIFMVSTGCFLQLTDLFACFVMLMFLPNLF